MFLVILKLITSKDEPYSIILYSLFDMEMQI